MTAQLICLPRHIKTAMFMNKLLVSRAVSSISLSPPKFVNFAQVCHRNLPTCFNAKGPAFHLLSRHYQHTQIEVVDDEDKLDGSSPRINSDVISLERMYLRFQDRCQSREFVNHLEFVRILEETKRIINRLEARNGINEEILNILSTHGSILLRSSGKLMITADPKTREGLTGSVWQLLKEVKIPLDISHYNALLRASNENFTIYDPEKILSEIESLQLKPDRITFQRVIHQYCLQGNTDVAMSYLEKMKALGHPLTETIFSSLIHGYMKQESPPKMDEIFKIMAQNSIEPTSLSYLAAISSLAHQIPNKPQLAKELEQILIKVQDSDIVFNIFETIDIVDALIRLKDEHSFAQTTYNNIIENTLRNATATYKIIHHLVLIGQFDEASRIFWKLRPSPKSLESASAGSYYIKIINTNPNVPIDFVMSECEKIKEAFNSKPYYFLYYSAAEHGNLDLVRKALQELEKTMTIQAEYYWPLIAQATNKEEAINALKNDLSPNLEHSILQETFKRWIWSYYSDDPQELIDLNENELHYDISVLTKSFLDFAIPREKVQEAIKFIQETYKKYEKVFEEKPATSESVSEEENDDDDSYSFVDYEEKYRFLKRIAEESKDADLVIKAFKLCQNPQSRNRDFGVPSELIKVHILNGNLEAAVDIFLDIAKKRRQTPLKGKLLKACLENKDSDRLQKIMDASTEIYGEKNSLFDLAIECIKLDKLKQAQKIFLSPGFKVSPQRVYAAKKNSFRFETETEHYEQFVDLSKNLMDVDQNVLYKGLIDSLDRANKAERILNIWNKMQEENFQPSKQVLLMIANALERHNYEVPFRKPKKILV